MLSRSTLHLRNVVKSTNSLFPRLSRTNFSSVLSFKPVVASHGCTTLNQRFLATQAESRLADILKQEIASETKVARQRVPQPQTTIPGFQVKTDEAEVVLSKTHGDEKIKITFNVNNSVDPDEPLEGETSDTEHAPPSMISRPEFEIEVSKGNQKLVFDCFIEKPFHDDDAPPPHHEEGQQSEEDFIRISEIASYSGEPGEKYKVFTVSGDNIDGALYDSLIAYLEERGIDDKFTKNLTAFSTHYEHTQYVALLHKIKDFVGQK